VANAGWGYAATVFRPRTRPRRTFFPGTSFLTLDSNLLQALGEHACIEEARWAKTLFEDEDDDEHEDDDEYEDE